MDWPLQRSPLWRRTTYMERVSALPSLGREVLLLGGHFSSRLVSALFVIVSSAMMVHSSSSSACASLFPWNLFASSMAAWLSGRDCWRVGVDLLFCTVNIEIVDTIMTNIINSNKRGHDLWFFKYFIVYIIKYAFEYSSISYTILFIWSLVSVTNNKTQTVSIIVWWLFKLQLVLSNVLNDSTRSFQDHLLKYLFNIFYWKYIR